MQTSPCLLKVPQCLAHDTRRGRREAVPLTLASPLPPLCGTHLCVSVVRTRLHNRRLGRTGARARTLRGRPGPSCGPAPGSPSPRSTSHRWDGAGLTSFPGDKATTRVPSRGLASTPCSLLAAPALGQHPLGRTPALPRDTVAGSVCSPGARGSPPASVLTGQDLTRPCRPHESAQGYRRLGGKSARWDLLAVLTAGRMQEGSTASRVQACSSGLRGLPGAARGHPVR